MLNNLLAEEAQIVAGFGPADMAAAASTGDWVSLKGYERCTVVFFKGAGTAGDDPVLTLSQAQDVAGTGAKALNFTRVDVKQGTLANVGTFTAVTQAAANTYTEATSAEAAAIWLVEVSGEMLDVDGGFDCIRASVADTGTNPQLGACLYVLRGARYGRNPLPSAIAD